MATASQPPIILKPHQVIPDGDWKRLFLGRGRGWGKTIAGAAWVCRMAAESPQKKILLLCPRHEYIERVLVPAIFRLTPPSLAATYQQRAAIDWSNGAFANICTLGLLEKTLGFDPDVVWSDNIYPSERIENGRLRELAERVGARAGTQWLWTYDSPN